MKQLLELWHFELEGHALFVIITSRLIYFLLNFKWSRLLKLRHSDRVEHLAFQALSWRQAEARVVLEHTLEQLNQPWARLGEELLEVGFLALVR